MWFLNHYVGIINNDGAAVDQAVGIGVAGFMRVVFIEGAQAGIDSLPTLSVVLLGGLVGGITAAKLQQYLDRKANN